ncbi:monocarboxylate transporter 13-like [Lineus longissimus]|uniref:monocarboxylate transporter 13-like n=1 Tax=Lineus longissimus TaxID=88925 RepID=UPI002B4D23B4
MGWFRDYMADVNFKGYAVVVLATLVNIPVAGFMQSFGVFVKTFDKYYCPGDCLQLLGWIAALPYAINLIICLVVLRIQTRFGDRGPFIIGVILSAGSLVATSFVSNIYIMFGSYCLLFGIGSSLVMYVPFAVLDWHFPEDHPRHVLATSIVTLGAPVGVFIMNPLASYLDNREGVGTDGWRYSLRTFAVAILLLGLLPVTVMKRPTIVIKRQEEYEEMDGEEGEPTEPKPFISRHFRESFNTLSIMWVLTIMFISYGIFIPKIHFINYMSASLNVSEELAAQAIGYEGIAETISTLTVSLLGTLLSKHLFYFYLVGCGTLAVANGVLILADRYFEVVIYCMVHGAMDGFLMTLTFPIIDLVVKKREHRNYVWGFTQLGIGVGQLIGLPMTGFMYDMTKSYSSTFCTCAIIFGLSFFMVGFVFIGSKIRAYRNNREEEEDKEILSKPKDQLTIEAPPGGGVDNKGFEDGKDQG